MGRLENHVRKYGLDFGPILYHALQSQAAHARAGARSRRTVDVLTSKAPAPREPSDGDSLPLFPEHEAETAQTMPPVAVGA